MGMGRVDVSRAALRGDRWLLVGDAGSFIDPLSSAGVKKALASGWLAAVVAHTWLTQPEMRPHALGFFEDRETEIHRRFVGDDAAGCWPMPRLATRTDSGPTGGTKTAAGSTPRRR